MSSTLTFHHERHDLHCNRFRKLDLTRIDPTRLFMEFRELFRK